MSGIWGFRLELLGVWASGGLGLSPASTYRNLDRTIERSPFKDAKFYELQTWIQAYLPDATLHISFGPLAAHSAEVQETDPQGTLTTSTFRLKA